MTRLISPLALVCLLLCPPALIGARAYGRTLPPADVLSYFEVTVGIRIFDVTRSLSPAQPILALSTSELNRMRVYWSPDGSQMTYLGNDGSIVIADGYGVPQRVHPQAFNGSEFTPVWRPDSAGFAFAGGRGAVDNISYYDTAEGTFRDLTQLPGSLEYAPQWSPDGTLLLYTAFDSTLGRSRLNLGDPLNPALTPRTLHESMVFHYQPAWSPDGRYIAFSTVNSQSERELRVYDLFTGASLEPIAAAGLDNLTPAWNGGYLGWLAADVNGLQTMVINYASGELLHSLPTTATFFQWSPTAPQLVYLDVGTLSLLDLTDGTTRPLANRYDARPADIVGVAWSPDGGRIGAALLDRNGLNIFLIDLPSGHARRLTTSGLNTAPQWRPN